MAQKNETLALSLSLLVTLGLLGAGGWWLAKNMGFVGPDQPAAQLDPERVDALLSWGERSLIAAASSPAKQQGIAAIASGDHVTAVTQLEASLQANRNDPEALIYLNNARIGNLPSYNIAVVAPLGSAVNPAKEILRGVAQAQTEINQANGIQGVPLKVLIADDNNDEATAQQLAATLVATPNILGVIGHFSSGVTLGAAPVYTDGGLVVISPTSTSVKLSGVSDYVFRTVPSDRFAGSALARYMLNDLGKQDAAVFFNSESGYSTSLKDEFTTATFSDGGQVVAEFDLVGPGFEALQAVEQSIQQGAEVLMLAANTPTLDAALQVITVNRKRLVLLGGDSLYNPKTLQVGGDAAIDMGGGRALAYFI